MREYLSNPRITPLQYLFSMISVVVFLFIGTKTFAELSDGYKTVIYIAFTVTAVLSGFNFTASKAIRQIRDIWTDSKLSIYEKIQKIGNVVLIGLTKMNEGWVELNKEQGTDPGINESTMSTVSEDLYIGNDNSTQ